MDAFPTGSTMLRRARRRARDGVVLRRRHQRTPRRADDQYAEGIRSHRAGDQAHRDDARRRRCWSRPAVYRPDSVFPPKITALRPRPTSSTKTAIASAPRAVNPRRRRSSPTSRDLKVGDLIVHVDHGIGDLSWGSSRSRVGARHAGVYRSSATHGDDKLFVPVERLDLVQKYTGGGAAVARSAWRHDRGKRPRRASRRRCATWPASC